MSDSKKRFARLTLLVPGTPGSLEAWASGLRAVGLAIDGATLRGDGVPDGVGVQWNPNDGHFGEAFSYGTVTAHAVRAIDAAPGALIVTWPEDLRDGREGLLSTGQCLREAGALAVRLEQSKMGWEVGRWLELLGHDDPGAWHHLAVAFLRADGALQTCGMHAFSMPDARIELGDDPRSAEHFVATLNLYQIAEDPVLLSGQRFAPDAETPRRAVQRWPDTEYPSGHACHNPFGVWRLGPPGGTASPPGGLAQVFVPALRVLLSALEGRSDTPLTRDQVEGVRDQGVCITMDHRDAQRMERQRGYADLDPELVWEQWQCVRASDD